MGTPVVTPQVVKPKALHCPNCGGPVELRGFSHTLSVVCPQCLTVLDSSNPQLAILQRFTAQQRMEPLIPLGSRGKFGNTVFEVIGFQYRGVQADEESYGWSEYLLFNPYYGFRYLSEYQGHWNFIRVLSALPESLGFRKVRFNGLTYKQFDQGMAVTAFVLGEFPWQVHVGEQVTFADYVSPPYMLSSETTEGEVTWSFAEYYAGRQIWDIFKLPGAPQRPVGIFPNQPSPLKGKAGPAWRTWLWLMAALCALAGFFAATAGRHEVFRQKYSFTPGTPSEASFVTGDFDLTGRPSNLEIDVTTNLYGDWMYLNFALVNQTTEKARDFGREISYYGDEGSPRDRVVLAAVPAGKYYLRVEPEKQAGSSSVNYEIVVRRDVPTYGWFWLAALLLLIPPVIVTIRSTSFEGARWRESDFAPRSSGG